MMLDPRGTLWLVDWGISGFYPEYMEYFGMDATSSLCSMEWLRERTWAAWWDVSGGRCFVGLQLVPLCVFGSLERPLATYRYAPSDSD